MGSESMDRKVNLRPRLTEELRVCKLATAMIKGDLMTHIKVISRLKPVVQHYISRNGALLQKIRLLIAKQAKVTKDFQQLKRERRQKKKNPNPQQGQLQGQIERRFDQVAQQMQINCDLEAVLKELRLQVQCHLNFPGLSEMELAVIGGAQTAGTIPAEEKDAPLHALGHRRQPAEGMLTTACPAETEPTVTGDAQTTAEEKEASLHALDLQKACLTEKKETV